MTRARKHPEITVEITNLVGQVREKAPEATITRENFHERG